MLGKAMMPMAKEEGIPTAAARHGVPTTARRSAIAFTASP